VRTLLIALLITPLALAVAACRGGTSTSQPIHLVLDMDFQQKLKTQSQSHFPGWVDGRSMRLPISRHDPADPTREETLVVARGSLPDSRLLPDPKKPGKNADGSWMQNPVLLTEEVLARGKERFEIFCSVCHGYTGRGGNGTEAHGMAGRRWPVAIPSFHFDPEKEKTDPTQNRVAKLTDGEIFDVLSSPIGKSTMPSYAARISVEDRWKIIHYVRALQNLDKP
jgi:mono/diheme cytochrome c family protein